MAGTVHPVLRALRPEPHRGDQVAAGVVVLATLVLLVEVRFAGTWGSGARFVVAALAAGFVGAMAYLSPVESDRPRSFQSVLYVSTCLLTLLALLPLATWLGAHGATSPGALTWIALVTGTLALAFSLGRNSPYCTLVAALAFTVGLQAAVQWIFDPAGAGTARWIFLLILLADLLGVAMLRDRRRRHAVMLVNAGAVAVLGIALTLAIGVVNGLIGGTFRVTVLDGGTVRDIQLGVPWGWALVGFATGFGLVAYAGADREPGPGYLGVLVLAVFAVLAGIPSDDASIIGWPLVLALIAGAFLVIGLRPDHPLPPEPAEDVGTEPRSEPLPPGVSGAAGLTPVPDPPGAPEGTSDPPTPAPPDPALPPRLTPDPHPQPPSEPVDPPPDDPATDDAADAPTTVREPPPEAPTDVEPSEDAPTAVHDVTPPPMAPEPEPADTPETTAAPTATPEPAADDPADPDPDPDDPEDGPPSLRERLWMRAREEAAPHHDMPPVPEPPRLAPHPDADDERTREYPPPDDDEL